LPSIVHRNSSRILVAMTDPPPPLSRVVPAAAVVVLLAHVAANLVTPYGLHRDAFLYLAMGRHLDLFRMDFPPFIALVAEATRAVLGDSTTAIRTGPALAHAAVVLTAGLAAREAGGRAWAQAVTVLAVATAPLYLRAGALFQPVVFDQLWWTLGLFLLARIGARAARGEETRRPWLALGAVLGLGLLTKFTILVLGAAMLGALLVTPLRRELRTPWPWLAGAAALVLGSPGWVGQLRLGFPLFTQVSGVTTMQVAAATPAAYVADQLFQVGPALVLGLAGGAATFRVPDLRPYWPVAWSAALAWIVLLLAGGKAYYIGPIWPVLIGLGAAAAGRWAERPAERGRRAVAATARGGIVAALAVWAALTVFMGLPLLPPAAMARYAAATGVTAAVSTNTGAVLRLPQDYADMLGWEHLVDEVARVYDALPPGDRARAAILASNYGEAGAIDFYGPARGLPGAIATTGSYWFFGPGDLPGEILIGVGVEPGGLSGYYASAILAARSYNPWGVPEEQDVPISVARGPERTLQDVWPEFGPRS
jgi:4-amino-4-deoxy-L-arabinose transferase-like glycosyltransferase